MALLRMLGSRTLGRLVAELQPVAESPSRSDSRIWAGISIDLIGIVLRERESQL
jgi:hypothetical protein